MKTSTRKNRKSSQPKFENRVRFNWGFHDATFAVEQGWAVRENNFGFCHHGPLAGLRSSGDVISKHFDKTYAQGWMEGYLAMTTDETARPTSSDEAWIEALKNGYVSE